MNIKFTFQVFASLLHQHINCLRKIGYCSRHSSKAPLLPMLQVNFLSSLLRLSLESPWLTGWEKSKLLTTFRVSFVRFSEGCKKLSKMLHCDDVDVDKFYIFTFLFFSLSTRNFCIFSDERAHFCSISTIIVDDGVVLGWNLSAHRW